MSQTWSLVEMFPWHWRTTYFHCQVCVSSSQSIYSFLTSCTIKTLMQRSRKTSWVNGNCHFQTELSQLLCGFWGHFSDVMSPGWRSFWITVGFLVTYFHYMCFLEQVPALPQSSKRAESEKRSWHRLTFAPSFYHYVVLKLISFFVFCFYGYFTLFNSKETHLVGWILNSWLKPECTHS